MFLFEVQNGCSEYFNILLYEINLLKSLKNIEWFYRSISYVKTSF